MPCISISPVVNILLKMLTRGHHSLLLLVFFELLKNTSLLLTEHTLWIFIMQYRQLELSS